ncbi:hypothetical protein [Streptomyces sp. B21-101]|uniref:hypothetical protein n=1 Tax=Streptomyces sp. B21-101 TaxID=3039415 RepID=UPI003FA747A6
MPASEGVNAVFQRVGDVHGEHVGRPEDDDVRIEGRQTAPAVGAVHGLRIAERGDKVWRSVRTEAGLPDRLVHADGDRDEPGFRISRCSQPLDVRRLVGGSKAVVTVR